jgi:hypothetical protein
VLSRLTYESFEPRLNEMFEVHHASSEPRPLQLVEVNVIGKPIPGVTTRDAFSLVFRGPRDPMLGQATYRFENEKMGPLEFMIVPIGVDESGLRYEAVFT